MSLHRKSVISFIFLCTLLCATRSFGNDLANNNVGGDSGEDENLKEALLLVELLKNEYTRALRENFMLQQRGDEATTEPPEEPTCASTTSSSIAVRSSTEASRATTSQKPTTTTRAISVRRNLRLINPFHSNLTRRKAIQNVQINKNFRRRMPSSNLNGTENFRRRMPSSNLNGTENFRRRMPSSNLNGTKNFRRRMPSSNLNGTENFRRRMPSSNLNGTENFRRRMPSSNLNGTENFRRRMPSSNLNGTGALRSLRRQEEVSKEPAARESPALGTESETATAESVAPTNPPEPDATTTANKTDATKSENPINTNGDTVLRQVVVEPKSVMESSQQQQMSKSTTPGRTRRTTRNTRYLSAIKATLKIHLSKSTRLAVPLSKNNAFCYYNPMNALCRTSV